MSKVYKGSGGLWLGDNIKANSTAPRWSGAWTCSCCGHKDHISGYGADQQDSRSHKAPTISLRLKR